jgi:hypothetical protein
VALCLLVVPRRVYKWSMNPFTNPNPVYTHTPIRDNMNIYNRNTDDNVICNICIRGGP